MCLFDKKDMRRELCVYRKEMCKEFPMCRRKCVESSLCVGGLVENRNLSGVSNLVCDDLS